MSDNPGPGDKASREEKEQWMLDRFVKRLTRTRQPVTPHQALMRVRAELLALTTEPEDVDEEAITKLGLTPPTAYELFDALDCLQELVDKA